MKYLFLLLINFCLFSQDYPEQIAPLFYGYNFKPELESFSFTLDYPTTSNLNIEDLKDYDPSTNKLPFTNREGKYADSNCSELIWNSIFVNSNLSFEAKLDFFSQITEKPKAAVFRKSFPVMLSKASLVKQKIMFNEGDKKITSILISNVTFPQLGFWWKFGETFVRLASASAADSLADTGFSHLNLMGFVENPKNAKYRFLGEVDGLVPYVKSSGTEEVVFQHPEFPVLGQQKFLKRKLYHLEYYNLDYLSSDVRGDFFIDTESLLPVYWRSFDKQNKVKYISYIISSVDKYPFIAGGFVKVDAKIKSFLVRSIKPLKLTDELIKDFDPNLPKEIKETKEPIKEKPKK